MSLRFLPVLAGVLVPCFIYFYFFNHDAPLTSLPDAVEISNQPFPDIRLVDFENNTDFSEKIRTGKVLIIYLSSTCSACKKDVRLLSQNYERLWPKVGIYGVSFEWKTAAWRLFDETGKVFPILKDENMDLFRTLGIRYFPTKFLIKDGVIVKTFFGNFANEQKLFEDLELGATE